MSRLIPVITGDLSHTLFIPELNEHYHSTFGAIRESEQVFIRAGLQYLESCPLTRILEIGMGTGLNVLLAWLHGKGRQGKILYTAIEPFPVGEELCGRLNYPERTGDPDAVTVFREIHQSPWNSRISLTDSFHLIKIKNTVREVSLPESSADLVFYDAFGPVVQPEMWTQEVFEKIFRILDHGGILVTYSSRGSVRRALSHAGFRVEKLPGPPGKRHITRAVKS
jgi:tRNA U34 5-methylaminomethyl-2-thiouridine-forming methyltransferase MnmC